MATTMLSQQVDPEKDTEIVLGTGKLLAIFFGLVLLCGTFFGLGYSVGHSASPMAIQTGQSGKTSASNGAKPLAGVTVTTPAAPQDAPPFPANDPNSAANAQVDQTPPPQNQTASASDSTPAPSPTLTPVSATQSDSNSSASPAVPASGTLTVQVAAVTKQEDAQALVSALQKKNYPVFISSNNGSDNLYHVQVGPFAELKDAEAMKSKLAGDGYNAIVKK
jgi:cell division septation protein DedD